MKQIIEKNYDGSIHYKYYINHLNQSNGLCIGYYTNGSICWKLNYLNGKRFSLDYWYGNNNNKPTKIIYYI